MALRATLSETFTSLSTTPLVAMGMGARLVATGRLRARLDASLVAMDLGARLDACLVATGRLGARLDSCLVAMDLGARLDAETLRQL
jgi:hypothetical protein